MVLVDSYSDFIEVIQLKDTTSATIVEILRQQFSRYGIPDVLVSENGPQFTSREFGKFSREWEFKHVTSSPYHPKSNGKAESAVKVAKNIFKKAYRDNQDPWLAMLDQRNTPTQGVDSSPVQRLMSRRTQTLVPMSSTLLYPKVVEGVNEKLQVKRQKAKSYHDRSTKILPELEIGQEVRVASQKNKTWDRGTCVQKLSDRSYAVQASGEIMRRNRHDLRPERGSDTTVQAQPSTAEIENAPSTTVPTLDTARSEKQATSMGWKETIPSKVHSYLEPKPDKITRTRTRIVRPPVRYGDV